MYHALHSVLGRTSHNFSFNIMNLALWQATRRNYSCRSW